LALREVVVSVSSERLPSGERRIALGSRGIGAFSRWSAMPSSR
jgi:hypothetical protein